METFGLFWKASLLTKNFLGYFLGNFWKSFWYFYFNIWSHWFYSKSCTNFLQIINILVHFRQRQLLHLAYFQPLLGKINEDILLFQKWAIPDLSLKIANDWIRTADHWYRKQPLCQLSHNHWLPNAYILFVPRIGSNFDRFSLALIYSSVLHFVQGRKEAFPVKVNCFHQLRQITQANYEGLKGYKHQQCPSDISVIN